VTLEFGFSGQGFELRYKAFLAKGNSSAGAASGISQSAPQSDMYGDAAIYDQAETTDTYGDVPAQGAPYVDHATVALRMLGGRMWGGRGGG
jgi:hypothetical protein